MGLFSSAIDSIKSAANTAKSAVSDSTPFKKANSFYRDKMGITAAEEAEDAYNKAIKENTGEAGDKKAWETAQKGAQTIGFNTRDQVQNAAAQTGATRGEAAALGQNAVAPAIQSSLNAEYGKAAQANQGLVDAAGQNLENKIADVNSRKETLGKAIQLGASAIGSAFGPAGGMIGNTVGGLIGGALSDERSKVGLNIGKATYQSKIKNKRLKNE